MSMHLLDIIMNMHIPRSLKEGTRTNAESSTNGGNIFEKFSKLTKLKACFK